MKKLKTVLTIAGSDSSGGAGIQADIKTMLAHGVYAMSAITALTAQNTMGVYDIWNTTPENLAAQLDAVFTDIFPDAVKIGMVSETDLIHVIAKKLKEYQAVNIVVDPVMVATSGAKLLTEDAMECLTEELFPLATLITPNIPEAEVLNKKNIRTTEEMEWAALALFEKYQVNVLLKGGHLNDDASDVLACPDGCIWFSGKQIANPNTHGTGCTLSSAIASNLAKGNDLETSARKAKDYLTGALNSGLSLGKGKGPLDHGYKAFL